MMLERHNLYQFTKQTWQTDAEIMLARFLIVDLRMNAKIILLMYEWFLSKKRKKKTDKQTKQNRKTTTKLKLRTRLWIFRTVVKFIYIFSRFTLNLKLKCISIIYIYLHHLKTSQQKHIHQMEHGLHESLFSMTSVYMIPIPFCALFWRFHGLYTRRFHFCFSTTSVLHSRLKVLMQI